MPQMAPLNWLTLMIMFIMMFYAFNAINFYKFLYKTSTSKKFMLKNIKLNWKW